MIYPKVTVVVTTYNRPEMLKEAVAAIAKQTFTDYELIVVDDGSNTAEKALEPMKYLFEGKRFLIMQMPENSGFQSVPNNTAFQYAHGSYIAQADDDDLWDEDHLETLVDAIERERVDLVYSRFRVENSADRGGPTTGWEFPYVPYNYLTQRLLVSQPQNNFINSHTLWSKASIFIALGSKPWDEDIRKFGDWDFFRRASLSGLQFYGVDKVTLTYRWGHEQIQLDRPLEEGTALVVPKKPPSWDKHREVVH